ncbi:MAG: OmpH family outer membrane protein [Bacteroides sp.]|nr:OmpH family outer membrane protein [Prevotella sp.]MCM1408158.1 OmpH family outer membrane protein [Treponema brennaborense]MCM1469482.1 OmpH family outer membrane protein [Bacteroides sp.]
MKKYIAVVITCMIPFCVLHAQQQITRFGVVDTSKVFTTYFRESSAVRNYENKKTEFQAEINRQTEALKKLQLKKAEYAKNGDSAAELRTDTEITKKAEFLSEYTRAKNYELETIKKKLSASDDFYGNLYDVIGRIAEAEGYSMILSLQQANTILWYSPTVDITDKVISRLNLQ